MRFFEFAAPQSSSVLKDLEYLLKNAIVDSDVIQKALAFLKKKTEPEKDLQQDKQSVEPGQKIPAQPSIDSKPESPQQIAPVKESTEESLKDELMQYAKKANADDLQKIVYYIKLDSFKDMATEVIKNKIKVKANAITYQIHLAVSDLAGKTSVQTMTDFLNDCKAGGVIDTESMIQKSDGQVKPIPVSREDYRIIVSRLLDTNLGGASASGKGEFGLAFAGINATKGEKDITIGGQDIEVKASQRRADFFFKGQTGFESVHTKQALVKLIDALNSVGGEFARSNEIGKGGIAQINPKTLKMLNPYFAKLGRDAVSRLLIDIVNTIHADHDVSQFNNEIAASVNDDGTVDYNKLLLATGKLSFFYYQKIEKHPGVLMLNISNSTYMYQDTAEDFANLLTGGAVAATSAIDFRGSTKGSLTFKLN